jgi:hypothetical protein
MQAIHITEASRKGLPHPWFQIPKSVQNLGKQNFVVSDFVMYELFALITSFPAANFTVAVNTRYIARKVLMTVENELGSMWKEEEVAQILSQYFSGANEVSHGRTSDRVTAVPTKTQTKHFPNMSETHCLSQFARYCDSGINIDITDSLGE